MTTPHTPAPAEPGPPTGQHADQHGELLTPGEVARLFRVDPKTVARWASCGLLPHLRTPGGHRRYPRSQIHALYRIHPTGPRPDTEQETTETAPIPEPGPAAQPSHTPPGPHPAIPPGMRM